MKHNALKQFRQSGLILDKRRSSALCFEHCLHVNQRAGLHLHSQMSRLEVSGIKVFIKKYSVELKTYGNFWTKIIKGISKASLEFPCVRPKTATEWISTGVCIRRSTVVPFFWTKVKRYSVFE